ncbi:unnamed protein product [Gongylonema pulchrum]|uniref:Uncharacterized protein n=1 Tax=Gongylonema pulchrum TaxID=637853 RepID=A0A183EYY5_9BILA|nr:unnamed protein product [Gongylonema pulchrum]
MLGLISARHSNEETYLSVNSKPIDWKSTNSAVAHLHWKEELGESGALGKTGGAVGRAAAVQSAAAAVQRSWFRID